MTNLGGCARQSSCSETSEQCDDVGSHASALFLGFALTAKSDRAGSRCQRKWRYRGLLRGGFFQSQVWRVPGESVPSSSRLFAPNMSGAPRLLASGLDSHQRRDTAPPAIFSVRPQDRRHVVLQASRRPLDSRVANTRPCCIVVHLGKLAPTGSESAKLNVHDSVHSFRARIEACVRVQVRHTQLVFTVLRHDAVSVCCWLCRRLDPCLFSSFHTL